jgi:predicted carbohydrate-binding protein with CBM5 and CBM33 domain
MTACEECGYQFESLDRAQILRALTALAAQQRQLLEAVEAPLLRAHPLAGSWSALEYGCHVRDVLRFQRDRVAAAQTEDVPAFGSMRRDERAVEQHYNEQDPRAVAGQLASAARDFVAALTALDDAGWLRTGVYPWPVRAVRTVEWIGQRTAHELAHHLLDCKRLLAAVPG